ncbi:NAD(P)-binding protein [Thozetella sp. PMI_491]|nr:NAD(P)-binding protein [Thozetella sp. PMI_491]
MPSQDFTIKPGSWILVTGANGYIASHIVDILLELGFNVRGTVRDHKPWLDKLFQDKYGKDKFESVLVPVMESSSAFDAAMEGVSGVIHVATDVSMSNDANSVIANVKQATINALAAAAKHKSIKRFVLTSSSSAALIPETNKPGVIVDEGTWNDEAVRLAWSDSAPEEQKGYVVYAASKTEGERAAWKWVSEEKPDFVLNTVLPNCNVGRILDPEHQSGSTMGFIRNLFKGNYAVLQMLPPQYYVHVRDCAYLHIAALLSGAVKNERIFAFAGEYNWTDALSILRKLRPGATLPSPPENEGRDLSVIVPKDRAEQLLREFSGQAGWKGLEESLTEGIEDMA